MSGWMIRQARLAEGISQRELGDRLGISQPAVAQMEAAGDEISVGTFRRAMRGLDRRVDLIVRAPESAPSIDETLLIEQAQLTPAERMARFEGVYESVREMALAGAAAR